VLKAMRWMPPPSLRTVLAMAALALGIAPVRRRLASALR
jgi:hypothetical protein